MQAAQDTVVTFHYSVRDDAGQDIDTSRDNGQPLSVLIGHRNIITGVEKALLGREAGDRFEVTVPPADGYGERREGFTQRVPKKYFPEPGRLHVGQSVVLNVSGGGQRAVTVLKIGSSVVDVDLNPPLAGKVLQFDIEVIDVRAATPEELAHHHVHAAGAHAH